MDRTAWIAIILCSIGLIAWWEFRMKPMNEALRKAQEEEVARKAAEKEKPNTSSSEQGDPAAGEKGAIDSQERVASDGDSTRPESRQIETETLVTLTAQGDDGDVVNYVFTSKGGGVKSAILLNHEAAYPAPDKKSTPPVILNEYGRYPVGALCWKANSVESTEYEVLGQTEESVTFRAVINGLQVTKKYQLRKSGAGNAHFVDLSLDFANLGEKPIQTGDFSLFLGMAAPSRLEEIQNEVGFLFRRDGSTKYWDSNHFKKESRRIDESAANKLLWAGVANQFFVNLISTKKVYEGNVWGSRRLVELNEGEAMDPSDSRSSANGVFGGIGLIPETIEPNTSLTTPQEYQIFLGPKSYSLLSKTGLERGEALRYDAFPVVGWMASPISKLLMSSLTGIHAWGTSFAAAIIILTIIIRFVIWPLTFKAQMSMKRMSKLAPLMTELKEKYPDNPQKMNTEMMALYRDYGVNPMGGCFPMLIQMPIFIGFFQMLRSAVELRHESFFWVKDLALPDTVFELGGMIPVNPLPLVMGITMFLQMKMTPQSGDPMQRKIFMFMPLIITAFCYNFAAALSLYWTTSNIFSIFQTMVMKKFPEPELKKVKRKPLAAPSAPGQKERKPKPAGPRTGGSKRKKRN